MNTNIAISELLLRISQSGWAGINLILIIRGIDTKVSGAVNAIALMIPINDENTIIIGEIIDIAK